MNQNQTQQPVNSDNTEPGTAFDPVPIWLILGMGLLLYWSLVYLSDHAGGFEQQVYAPFHSFEEVVSMNPKSAGDEQYIMGQDVFNKTCTACHQPNGMGKDGMAPPLVGSEWVLAPGPNRIAHIALYGLTGPVNVKGKDWNLTMLAWKDVYDDKQIAAVLTYIRNTWGNKAPPVKTEQVTAARKENHPGYETAPELQQLPVQ